MTEPAAQRYGRIADAFSERVDAVDPGDWNRPAPCEGWVARDVVGHLVEWVPGFLQTFAAIEAPALRSAADNPAGAWHGLDGFLRGLFDDPATAEREIQTPMGTMAVDEAIDRFVTTDVLVHAWDLARATGLDDTLPDVDFNGLLQDLEPIEAVLRESGQYGPRIVAADDASPQDRLLAFLGRDPAWEPTS